jgi:threonine dehydratase
LGEISSTRGTSGTGGISVDEVRAAAARIAPYLGPTPLRRYGRLDALVGHGVSVYLKHENHQPTQSFKVRNGLSALTALDAAARARGVIAATTGNHGLGLAYAGSLLGVQVTIVVPEGNNPSKNANMRALGAELIEVGATYDVAVATCARLADERGLALVHSTNNADVLAGAGTMTLELLTQAPELDAVIIALGGGSQAVGAITVARALKPSLAVYAVQSSAASAQHDSWHRGERLTGQPIGTFAEGIATGGAYEMTFDTLRSGLTDFVLVSDDAIAQSMRDLIDCTGNLPEGAGAAGLAGAKLLAPRLAGRNVAVILCGGNASVASVGRAVGGEGEWHERHE